MGGTYVERGTITKDTESRSISKSVNIEHGDPVDDGRGDYHQPNTSRQETKDSLVATSNKTHPTRIKKLARI